MMLANSVGLDIMTSFEHVMYSRRLFKTGIFICKNAAVLKVSQSL